MLGLPFYLLFGCCCVAREILIKGANRKCQGIIGVVFVLVVVGEGVGEFVVSDMNDAVVGAVFSGSEGCGVNRAGDSRPVGE